MSGQSLYSASPCLGLIRISAARETSISPKPQFVGFDLALFSRLAKNDVQGLLSAIDQDVSTKSIQRWMAVKESFAPMLAPLPFAIKKTKPHLERISADSPVEGSSWEESRRTCSAFTTMAWVARQSEPSKPGLAFS